MNNCVICKNAYQIRLSDKVKKIEANNLNYFVITIWEKCINYAFESLKNILLDLLKNVNSNIEINFNGELLIIKD